MTEIAPDNNGKSNIHSWQEQYTVMAIAIEEIATATDSDGKSNREWQ